MRVLEEKTLTIMIDIDLSRYKGIVFDLDGTMIDNSSFHVKAWELFCKKHELAFSVEL